MCCSTRYKRSERYISFETHCLSILISMLGIGFSGIGLYFRLTICVLTAQTDYMWGWTREMLFTVLGKSLISKACNFGHTTLYCFLPQLFYHVDSSIITGMFLISREFKSLDSFSSLVVIVWMVCACLWYLLFMKIPVWLLSKNSFSFSSLYPSIKHHIVTLINHLQ